MRVTRRCETTDARSVDLENLKADRPAEKQRKMRYGWAVLSSEPPSLSTCFRIPSTSRKSTNHPAGESPTKKVAMGYGDDAMEVGDEF